MWLVPQADLLLLPHHPSSGKDGVPEGYPQPKSRRLSSKGVAVRRVCKSHSPAGSPEGERQGPTGVGRLP